MSNPVIACGIDTGILLEAGTNELEILVLRAGDSLFGVNVAKVREVLTIDRPTRLPQSHAAVEGTVQIRGQVVELVNLVQFLFGVGEVSRPRPTDKMVVLEFNQDLIAFRLNGVEQIFRTSWNTVQPMPHIRGHKAPVTGIVLREGRLIQMLDFESIGANVGMSRQLPRRTEAPVPTATRADLPIVFAEDSPLVSEMLQDTLQQAGYRNVTGFVDGQAAWNHLQELAAQGPAEDLWRRVGVLVSDVEMPRLDGLTLTRRIRDNPLLAALPVVIFSSIVSRDNAKKGQQVGADAQVAKPRYAELASTLERLLAEKYPQALPA
jgi:two-component system chemotaxis response regulator CheV